jgi:hypothetical protein
MTTFGKVLILVNLAASLLMATFAVGVFTNSDGKAIQAQAKAKVDQVTELWKSVRPAEKVWSDARDYLLAQEKARAADRVWYQQELRHLREGARAGDPARAIVFDPRNPPGRPRMVAAKDRDGKELLSLRAYDEEEKNTLEELDRLTAGYKKAIEATTMATERFLGPKGLHARIKAEKEKREEVVKEMGLVRPQLVNTVVDSELVLKRQRELVARIKELEGVGVATRGP